MPVIQVLFFQPGETPTVREVEGTRAALREMVGSPVAMGTLCLERWRNGRAVEMFCDDHGRENGLAPTLYAVGPDFQGRPVFGPAVLMRLSNYRQGTFEALTTEEDFYKGLPLLQPRKHALPKEVPYRVADEKAMHRFMEGIVERRRAQAAAGERIP